MAGHYVLNGLTKRMAEQMNSILNKDIQPGQNLSRLHGIYHPPGAVLGNTICPGWTSESRRTLQACFDNQGIIADRTNLPPHYYYVISVNNPHIRTLVSSMNIPLVRTNNFHLTALNQDAQTQWNNNKSDESLVTQVGVGNVSLEVYYIDGLEV